MKLYKGDDQVLFKRLCKRTISTVIKRGKGYMVSDIAWGKGYTSHPILGAVSFIVPFQVTLRSLFISIAVALVVPFQVRCLNCCSISSPRVEDVSFKFLPYCCDPLNSHTRKRTRVVPTVSSQSFHRCS